LCVKEYEEENGERRLIDVCAYHMLGNNNNIMITIIEKKR